MCKSSTVKQTSGAGYQYEDKAGAYFLLCLLLGRHPFHHQAGLVTRVDFQTGADGWGFDDFLVTLESVDGTKQVGVSVKSNQQFSAEIIYAAPILGLWEQQLQLNVKMFDAVKNYCCLVQPPLSGNVFDDLNTLIKLAREQDAPDLDRRAHENNYLSADKLKLYESFACPAAFQQAATEQQLMIGNILSRFILLEFDFESNVSKSISEFINMAGDCLLNLNDNAPVRFFEKIVQLCAETKTAGGYLDLSKLIGLLRRDFSLKNYPTIEADIQRIKEGNIKTLSLIKTTIGNSFHINRDSEILQIKTEFTRHPVGCITAPSGFGKTSLAKQYVEELIQSGGIFLIWLNASHFEQAPEKTLQLNHDFPKIADLQNRPKIFIVIDGLERFYGDQQIQQLALFLNGMLTIQTKYEILFTCVSENFDELILKLHVYNFFDSALFKVRPENNSMDLLGMLTHFPNLADLLRNANFSLLLRNLKLLDALTFSLATLTKQTLDGLQATESELIDLLWKNQIESGPTGKLDANVVRTVAQQQADALQMGISNSFIDASAAAALSSIVAKGVMYEQEDYLYFQHNLYGDWARYKIIRSHAQGLRPYLSGLDISSPLWAKAIRQYGIFLLETKNKEQAWLTLVNQLADTPKEKVVKNLLLESVIFSTNTSDILVEIGPSLLENEGLLLRNLLHVFLLKATHSNPEVLKIAEQLKGVSVAEAAGYNRIPDFIYWLPILEFIYRHRTEIGELDYHQSAQISRDWLTFAPKGFLWRKEMAELANHLAGLVLNNRRFSYRDDKESKEKTFEGLFCGYSEIPEQGADLLRKFAQLVPPEVKQDISNPEYQARKSHRFRVAEKWPYGPYRDIDENFREVCLNRRVLEFVFAENTALANDILLACLIKEPRDDYYEHGLAGDLDLDVPRKWYPPTFRRGPFLNLLHIDPIAALSGIVKLVEFATTQWLSQFKDETEKVYITVNLKTGSKKFFGDVSVYLWYRNISAPPHSLVSALMAVERYLYEIREQQARLEACIDFLLEHSASIAIIGLLSSAGKAMPMLFKNRLRAIIETIEFYRWEHSNLVSFHLDQFGLNELPSSQRTEADEWNKELHRVRPLADIMIFQLLNSDDFKGIYKKITGAWELEVAPQRGKKGFDIYYDRILSFFNPENYRLAPAGDGQQYFEYVEPEALKVRMKPYRDSIDDWQIRPSPFMIYQFLDEKKEFQLKDLENLWELVEKLKVRKTKDWFNHLETPLSSILGSYILLLRFRLLWLESHPEYETVIFDYTNQTFARIKKEQIKVYNFSVQYDWNNFAPQLVAECWQLQDSEMVRGWISLVCLNLHEESIMRLFAYISRLRPWNDPAFISLQNYILRLAALPVRSPVAGVPDLEQQQDKLSQLFICGQLPIISEGWAAYRLHEPKQAQRRGWQADSDDEQLRFPGLQVSLLKAAFEKLPARELPTDNGERQHICFLWKQAFDQVMCQFGDPGKMKQAHDEYPNDFDSWVIRSIPALLLEDTGFDYMSVFAEPLLKFGYYLPEYVQMYGHSLLLNHLDFPEHYDKLISAWKKILSFCLPHENWQYVLGSRHEFLQLSLFLLDPQKITIWDSDFTQFTTIAHEQFISFFEEYYINPPVTIALCNFAKSVSGHGLLPIAFQLLDTAVHFYLTMVTRPVPKGKILQPFTANEQLAKLLSHSWEHYKEQIKSDLEMFRAYKELVVYLVSLHHVVGSELQSRLIE